MYIDIISIFVVGNNRDKKYKVLCAKNQFFMSEIKSKSFTLRSEDGEWLGQIVLTSDGMFASVTEWGNLSYAWRHFKR